MPNTFKYNSYHVLGLETSASQKSVIKRAKDILNFLKIDDCPDFDPDIHIFKDYRTLEAVKEALQKLESPKKKLKEYFFWFQIADEVDEKSWKLIKENKYEEAIQLWEKDSNHKTQNALLHKKNLAILLTSLQENPKYLNYLKTSVELWKSIVDSETFWEIFEKIYLLQEEQTASRENILDFKNNVNANLSDIYLELQQYHKNNKYIQEFQKAFLVKGEKTEKTLLEPALEAINDAVETISKVNPGEQGIITYPEKQKIWKSINSIHQEFDKLFDVGLYDDSKTKAMRDRVSDALRRISVSLSYNDKEAEFTLELAREAEKISGTEGTKDRLQKDIKTLKMNADYTKIVKPIEELWEAGKSKKMFGLINDNLAGTLSEETRNYLMGMKFYYEKRIQEHGVPIKAAPTLWAIYGCGTTIYGESLCLIILAIPIFFLTRYSVTSKGGGNYSFKGRFSLHPWQKFWNFGMLAFLCYLFVLPIFGNNNNSYSKGNSYQSTSTEADHWKGAPDSSISQPAIDDRATLEAIKNNLQTESNELDRIKAQLDTTYVNNYSQQEVNDYNELIHSFNARVRKYKKDLKDFNDRVDRYNASIHNR